MPATTLFAVNADHTPLTTDQRGAGFQRIADGSVDIGAFERQHSCTYQFAGFFQPVDNLPTVNMATAGNAIPVRFSLNGNKGLDIFAAGYPASAVIQCGSLDAVSTVEETVNAGGSTLRLQTRRQTNTTMCGKQTKRGKERVVS